MEQIATSIATTSLVKQPRVCMLPLQEQGMLQCCLRVALNPLDSLASWRYFLFGSTENSKASSRSKHPQVGSPDDCWAAPEIYGI
jgi:hypothetical protein